MEVKQLPSQNPNQVARTQVGNYVVSTIEISEELRGMDEALVGIFDTLGGRGLSEDLDSRYDALKVPGNFESMVFHCDDDGEITDWSEVRSERTGTKQDAEEMHQRLVDEYRVKS